MAEKITDLHELVEKRSVFFANRVDTYARQMGLNNQEVVDRLCMLAGKFGKDKVTGILDRYMPPHLHSSQMPV